MQFSTILTVLAGSALAMGAAVPGNSPPSYSPSGGEGSGQGGWGGSGSGGQGGYSGGSGSGSGGSGGSGSGGYGGGNGGGEEGHYRCPAPLQGSPQCCEVNALGVASLTCSPLNGQVSSQEEFVKQCARDGKAAQCCVLPALGQGLVCQLVGQ